MKWLQQYFKQFLIVILIVTSCIAQSAPTVGPSYPRNDYLLDGDSLIPVPWGKEEPISWMLLSGSWMLRQGDIPTSYFTFKVVNQNGNSRILYIQQMDPRTCVVMGAGVGSLSSSKVIYATLRNAQNREVYRLNLRNFAASSFVKKVPSSYEGNVVMMSIAAINSYTFTHFSMARVNPGTLISPNCRNKLQ
tara:strand:+ start:273875 stop:274447 length:573 start_codon:yes stop_codon:yes gene_type:complete